MDKIPPEQGEFLYNESLSQRIRDVASGGNVCLAIAFWSEVGVSEIFPKRIPDGAKIICDISMGATSAEALNALGGPLNPNLRHLVGMHAKLCLSNKGLVVSSANASLAAIGQGGRPGHHTEAGVYHHFKSKAWNEATEWFNVVFKTARAVRDAEITWAQVMYRPRVPGTPQAQPSAGSLLSLVRAAPWRFANIGFVFVGHEVPEQQKDDIRSQAKNLLQESADTVDTLPRGSEFTGWTTDEVHGFPNRFFEFWQPVKALTIYGRRIEVRLPDHGSIMTGFDWHGLQKTVGVKLATRTNIAANDAELALRVLGKDKKTKLFSSGFQIADYIAAF